MMTGCGSRGHADRFAESKLVIDDTARLTLAHIRARLRGMARREPAQFAIIDYVQLMASTAGENRQREVSELVTGLKAIAREFRIPVVMLCQLNRGPEGRGRTSARTCPTRGKAARLRTSATSRS